ncbi:MAG: AAA family ATPase [Gammaproteobacteria bacterium]
MAETIANAVCLFLTPLQRAEVGVAHHLARLLRNPTPWRRIVIAALMPWWRTARIGSPAALVDAAVNARLTMITGGPGVGTTVVNSILAILRARRVKVLLCAPTGRAAKRLGESTGLEAKTIHRLLEFDPKDMVSSAMPATPWKPDLVVMDEVSMIDIVLMNQLLRAIPDEAAVLMVGDVDQLPSVGPGAVLADIVASERVPTVRLTEIFRQAAASEKSRYPAPSRSTGDGATGTPAGRIAAISAPHPAETPRRFTPLSCGDQTAIPNALVSTDPRGRRTY